MLRSKLRDAEATFDPNRRDGGMQNTVLVGYSMGGLLSKLQITQSGDAVWALASARPIDALVTTETTRALLGELFSRAPAVRETRRLHRHTPRRIQPGHEPSSAGRLGSSLVRRPADAQAMLDQIRRNNPGAVTPFFERPDQHRHARGRRAVADNNATAAREPHHAVSRHRRHGRPPAVTRQGRRRRAPHRAHTEGAISELSVPAFHTNIYRHTQSIEEVDRILRLHLDELESQPANPR